MKPDFFKTFIKYISIGILSFVIMLNFTSVSFISYADTNQTMMRITDSLTI